MAPRTFPFECPHCGETTAVDAGAMALLRADGCVCCGEPVDRRAFDRDSGRRGRQRP